MSEIDEVSISSAPIVASRQYAPGEQTSAERPDAAGSGWSS